ncbi:hypothetical protein OIU77_027825, partial [Salix suchowensis]
MPKATRAMPRPGVAWRNWLVSIGCFLHSSLLLKNSPVDPNGFPISLSLSASSLQFVFLTQLSEIA